MQKLAIAEIEEKLKLIEDSDPFFIKIAQDERKGVQKLLLKWKKQREIEQRLHDKFLEMTFYEKKWRQKGYNRIAGVDEVGRGPLAGPVVAAAVILPENFFLPGIDDSKKLSEAKREEYAKKIEQEAIAIAVSIIDAGEIDRINIYESTKKAMLTAIANLESKPDFLLIDAMKLETPYGYEAIIKGDAKSISIAAASIIAKVTRDRLMKEYALQFPKYKFQQNMGYGTKDHLDALKHHGITPIHRRSFAPIKDFS
ncbi:MULTISPECIES: ribonuclease HII [unclassified Bacillus (in: firmicutes)]|uniref:ribonuclease HII n=1 Tax=unclassified Bacillus (in: firmicutes) TaxID=185979 RepID=UPI0008EA63FE|nr:MULTISPECIES: ribonuclease HII [unclassified Bacillus (in: firmicutes)]SFA74300.1 RNase HII [Bacillus sp. UNCCL13]SFQ64537.1 RNase HII [Bacillus sp. cl95]